MLTAADIVLTLSSPIIFPVPVQIQGFGPDAVFDIDPVQSVEVSMGVDGIMSGGFVFTATQQNIVLQADSLSNDVFEAWWMQMQAAQTVYEAYGLCVIPALSKKYTLTRGMLTGYPPMPPGGRILGPRRYQITWQRITPSPL